MHFLTHDFGFIIAGEPSAVGGLLRMGVSKRIRTNVVVNDTRQVLLRTGEVDLH